MDYLGRQTRGLYFKSEMDRHAEYAGRYCREIQPPAPKDQRLACRTGLLPALWETPAGYLRIQPLDKRQAEVQVCLSRIRVGECTFRAVDGVLLDEFVVNQLSHLADEDSEYFEKLLNQKASDIFCSSQKEKELSDLRKKKAQLETAIANQVKNLREADDSLKRFIQEDVKALTDELSETDTLLQKIEDSRQSQMYAIRDIEEIKERLLSFGKYAENAAPDVLVTLIQAFVERIYITDENDERHCHIFIKVARKKIMMTSSGQPVT